MNIALHVITDLSVISKLIESRFVSDAIIVPQTFLKGLHNVTMIVVRLDFCKCSHCFRVWAGILVNYTFLKLKFYSIDLSSFLPGKLIVLDPDSEEKSFQ